MIRFLLGLLILFGVAGLSDTDPNATFISMLPYMAAGIALMIWGIVAQNRA